LAQINLEEIIPRDGSGLPRSGFLAFFGLPEKLVEPVPCVRDAPASERYIEIRDWLSDGGTGMETHILLGFPRPLQDHVETDCEEASRILSDAPAIWR
jgi:hypothetical protein